MRFNCTIYIYTYDNLRTYMKVTNKLFYFMLFFIISCTTTEVSLDNTYKLDQPFSAFGLGFEINYPYDWKVVETPLIAKKDYAFIKSVTKVPDYSLIFATLVAPANETVVQISVFGGGKPWTLSEVEKIFEASGTQIIEQKRIMLSNHEGLFSQYKEFNMLHNKVTESISIDLISEDKLFTIKYSAPSGETELFEKHKEEGLAIINSIKLNE